MSSQILLFDQPSQEHIHLQDGEIIYCPNWLSSLSHFMSTTDCYNSIRRDVLWQQNKITLYGKRVDIPRLNAWYGDPHCGYIYSETYFEPLPWLPLLLDIKCAIEKHLSEYMGGSRFNSALVNCYRNGQDSVAWHSDDEPELGKNPLVASLSLGAERVFQLRHKYNKKSQRQDMTLSDGDLLLMSGTTQHYWQHQIPKTAHNVGERINITFREIINKTIIKT